MEKVAKKTVATKRRHSVGGKGSGDLRTQFAQEAATAFKTLMDLMTNSEADAVRLRAAQDILDRAGLKAVERRELTGVTSVVNTSIDYSDPAAVAARIEELRRRLECDNRKQTKHDGGQVN